MVRRPGHIAIAIAADTTKYENCLDRSRNCAVHRALSWWHYIRCCLPPPLFPNSDELDACAVFLAVIFQGLEDSVSSWFDGDSMQSFFEFQVRNQSCFEIGLNAHPIQ